VLYQKIVADTVQQIMPKLLGIDAINNMIALEDLGKPMISLFYMMKKKITRTGTQPISRLFEWFAPKNSRRRWLMMSW
jgi:hypothetical protein